MNEQERIETAAINELAKQYYFSVRSGNKIQQLRYTTELFHMVIDRKHDCILYRKLQSKVLHIIRCIPLSPNGENEVCDIFTDLLLSYDYEKNDNFCAYANEYAVYKIKKMIKKELTKDKEPRNQTKHNDSEDSVINKIDYKFYLNDYDSDYEDGYYTNPETNAVGDTLVKSVFESLLAKINLFLMHKNSKQANPTRRSYYRIFYTETLMKFILNEFGSTDFISNKAEAYECSDGELVRFVSFSEYANIDDILKIRFKKYSDIMDDYNEDKRISVPFENVVICKYRYKAGLDAKEVSSANISIQKENYKKFIDEIKKVITGELQELC